LSELLVGGSALNLHAHRDARPFAMGSGYQ
jgi:hypothetical protein